ncbi:ddb1 and cul4 associated factor 7, partial [Nowakowskiella sp. JEL0078]
MSHRRSISIGNVSSTGGTLGNEVYSYAAPWPVYALHWSLVPGSFRIAFGSFFEEYANKVLFAVCSVCLIFLFSRRASYVNDRPVNRFSGSCNSVSRKWNGIGRCRRIGSPIPCYKTFVVGSSSDLMATAGDYLRVWELCQIDTNPVDYSDNPELDVKKETQFVLKTTLANVRKPSQSGSREFCAPLTSFDWNDSDPSLCVTASVDTTCTVWDINTQQAKTQLIAHDKE